MRLRKMSHIGYTNKFGIVLKIPKLRDNSMTKLILKYKAVFESLYVH